MHTFQRFKSLLSAARRTSGSDFWGSVETSFPEHKLTKQQHWALDATATKSLRSGSPILVVPDASTLPQLWSSPKDLIEYFNDTVATKQTIGICHHNKYVHNPSTVDVVTAAHFITKREFDAPIKSNEPLPMETYRNYSYLTFDGRVAVHSNNIEDVKPIIGRVPLEFDTLDNARDLCKFKYIKKEHDTFIDIDTVGRGDKVLVSPYDLPDEIELKIDGTKSVFCGTNYKCIALKFSYGHLDVNLEQTLEWDGIGSVATGPGDSGGTLLISIPEYEDGSEHETDVALGGTVRAGKNPGRLGSFLNSRTYTTTLPQVQEFLEYDKTTRMDVPVSRIPIDTPIYPEIYAQFDEGLCYPIEAVELLANEYGYNIMSCQEYLRLLLQTLTERDSNIGQFYISVVKSHTAGVESGSESVGPPPDASEEQLEFRKLRQKIWEIYAVVQNFKLDGHLHGGAVSEHQYDILKAKVDKMLEASKQLADDDVTSISKIIEDSQIETSPIYRKMVDKVKA